MNEIYTVKVYNTFTKSYEEVEVTKEVYHEYKRSGWTIDNNNSNFYGHEIQLSQLIGGTDGAYENFREFVEDGDSTFDAVLNDMRSEVIHQVLPTLTTKEQEVIQLIYFEGHSESVAGQALGISKQSVNERKQSALAKLKSDKRIF